MEESYINCESNIEDNELHILKFNVVYKGIKLFGKIIGGGNIDINYDSLDIVINKIKNNNVKDIAFSLNLLNNYVFNYQLLIKNSKLIYSTGYCFNIWEIPIVEEFNKGLIDLFNKLKLMNAIR
jgi:hypothetical protein